MDKPVHGGSNSNRQDRQVTNPLDYQIEQLDRRGIGPMNVDRKQQ
jgi:hypothetical protein